VPTIFSWPGRIPSGKVSMSLGSHLDLLATFAELASVKLPNKTLDSYSLAPLLLQDKETELFDYIKIQMIHLTAFIALGAKFNTSLPA
uniref:Sulfatase N-terminal domain-containing protein n=1 Tax=Amphimedon queenslandica TaxID=400682 RepID=A0A1X7SN44_AMPQE